MSSSEEFQQKSVIEVTLASAPEQPFEIVVAGGLARNLDRVQTIVDSDISKSKWLELVDANKMRVIMVRKDMIAGIAIAELE